MFSLSSPVPGELTGGSSGEHHLDFDPVDISEPEAALRQAETTCQLAIQQIQEITELQELFRDAGAITEKNMEELLPEKCVGDTIVDFYIKYLESKLSREHGKLFHFFSSFFFERLFQSTTATSIGPCKVDYERLRRWTKEVNLFEKEYVFIPILKSSHWSLVIICNLGNVTHAPSSDEMTRFPCIFHLDPLEGQHESPEALIRSYVLEAYLDKLQPPIDKHQLRVLYGMKYIQAKVPQQDNSHNCGLYVLHYIESFLEEFTSPNFSFASSETSQHFTRPHFASEVSSKRTRIQTVILKLQSISQKRPQKPEEIEHHAQVLMESTQKLRACLEDEGKSAACILDVSPVGPTFVNDEGCDINHASIVEDTMCAQHHQSNGILRENIEPLSGLQIGPVKYENRCQSLSPKQLHVKAEVQIDGLANANNPIFETKLVSTEEDAMDVQYHQPAQDLSEVRKGKNKRGSNMSKEETMVLLLCKLEGGRFCKGSKGTAHWNRISEEIGKKVGSRPSAYQCRLRYETLTKAYKKYAKHCMMTGKTFSEFTDKEREDMKLATSLNPEWYTILAEIYKEGNISAKHTKLSSNVCNDLHPLNSHDSPVPKPAPISLGRISSDAAVVSDSVWRAVEVALCNVIPAVMWSSLNEDLRSTLLNLVQECSWMDLLLKDGSKICSASSELYRRLSILQDCEESEILNHVFKLWQFGFVNVEDMVFEEGIYRACIYLRDTRKWCLKFEVYERISQEVLCKNPHLRTYCRSFPIEQSSLQYIQVLRLSRCSELEHLDLKELPSLQFLDFYKCPKLNLVTGWEVATALRSLSIWHCDAYHDFPKVQYLLSLRVISVGRSTPYGSWIPCQLSQFRNCLKLQKLEICCNEGLSEIVNLECLKDLKFLEVLSLHHNTYSSITGLSGLQGLKKLNLQRCSMLKSVPELGCLKGLTHLDMSSSGIEDVAGVGELHLLTRLVLQDCKSLERLPFLGFLKALVCLDLRGSRVTRIPGLEDLISLTDLKWALK